MPDERCYSCRVSDYLKVDWTLIVSMTQVFGKLNFDLFNFDL